MKRTPPKPEVSGQAEFDRTGDTWRHHGSSLRTWQRGWVPSGPPKPVDLGQAKFDRTGNHLVLVGKREKNVGGVTGPVNLCAAGEGGQSGGQQGGGEEISQA